MNKTDLIRQISDTTGVKLSEATRLVDAVFDTIVTKGDAAKVLYAYEDSPRRKK